MKNKPRRRNSSRISFVIGENWRVLCQCRDKKDTIQRNMYARSRNKEKACNETLIQNTETEYKESVTRMSPYLTENVRKCVKNLYMIKHHACKIYKFTYNKILHIIKYIIKFFNQLAPNCNIILILKKKQVLKF